MKTEVSSDKPITDVTLNSVATAVETGLSRYTDRLTRAEVHLENAVKGRGGRDVECTLEVRPAGRTPVIVTDRAASVDNSVSGTIGKMSRLLDSAFGKSTPLKGGPSASGQAT